MRLIQILGGIRADRNSPAENAQANILFHIAAGIEMHHLYVCLDKIGCHIVNNYNSLTLV